MIYMLVIFQLRNKKYFKLWMEFPDLHIILEHNTDAGVKEKISKNNNNNKIKR